MKPLPQSFFSRHAATVARNLLGCLLVKTESTGFLTGRIIETEAYHGLQDTACHGSWRRRQSCQAKLTQAFAITGKLDRAPLFSPNSHLFIAYSQAPSSNQNPLTISSSPRIGIGYATLPWRSKPWRFFYS